MWIYIMFIMENELQKNHIWNFLDGKTKSSVEFHSFIHSKIKFKMKVDVYVIPKS